MPLRVCHLLLALLWCGLAAAAQPQSADPVHDLLAEASQAVAQLDFPRARPLFDRAAAMTVRGDAAWQQAVFGQALAAQATVPATPALAAEAARLYHVLLDQTPDSRFAPRASLSLGRLAELGAPADLPAARTWYRTVMERWPDLEIAGEAALRLAFAYTQTNVEADVNQGIAALNDWLSQHPQDPLAAAQLVFLGNVEFQSLGNEIAALEYYRRADEIGFIYPYHVNVIYWRMAVLAERQHQHDLAVRCYTKVVTEAANSGKGYEAQDALRRLGAPVPALPFALTYGAGRPADAP